MRVVTDANETIELGETATAPTIGIVDYSRRTTDAFGVTTVVERGFARRMSVRVGVPFESVDTVQRRLAALRATPAKWVADDRFGSLAFRGFYKDFDLDLATPPLSTCLLTVEGVAASEVVADTGGDAAPAGQPSTLQLLQPTIVGDGVLLTSTVLENDAPAWVAGTTYEKGARVLRGNAHRIFESLIAANLGNDPTSTPAKWIDIGPTNRWAMFDQALGTSTTAANSISVTLRAGMVDAVALLDHTGATTRVQAAGYDRTLPVGPGTATFLDMPTGTGDVTVSITGPGQVSIGTLLIGRRVSLGLTEASPTAGITDFSRKEVDDFGEVTIVQRAFAKRMTAKALIRTDAVDQVFSRIAAVRARPSLWIGQAGLDCLTIYGFFKDFEIEGGESVSKLSLSIEGLSTAPPQRSTFILNDRGFWNAATRYKLGDVVTRDGSSWRYHAAEPSAGNALPTLPAEENVYWRILAKAGTDGKDGLNGTDGLDGTNGQSIHIAYANSANGTVDFTTGEAGGRAYIGVYTDTDPGADSNDPARYGWTLIRGADGKNGLAGPGGYVHIAYANSADGKADFHLSDPAGRRYIGTYTDQVEADSTNPAVYAWQLVKGADGTSAYNAVLSNETHTVPADAGGNVTSYAGAEFTLTVLYGSQDVTASFELGQAENPQALTGINDYPRFPITGGFDASEEIASVTYHFVGRAGTAHAGVRLTKVFSLAKSKGGANGSSPPLIAVEASSLTLRAGTDGNFLGGQRIDFTATRSAMPGTTIWQLINAAGSVVYAAPAATYAANFPAQWGSNAPDSLYLTPQGAVDNMNSHGGTQGRFSLRVYVDGYAQTDTVSIQKVQDGAPGAQGAPGASAYNAILDNEAHTVPADVAGNVTSYAGAKFTVTIFLGSQDVTGSFQLQSASNPQELVGVNNYPTFPITGGFDAGEDTATVTYTFAGKAGTPHAGVQLIKTFSLAKSKGGANGAAAAILSLSASSQVLRLNADGSLPPGAPDFVFTANRQNYSGAVGFSYDPAVHPTNFAGSTVSGDTFTVTAARMRDMLLYNRDTLGIGAQVKVRLSGGALSDVVTVTAVFDGTAGTNGTDGFIADSDVPVFVVECYSNGTPKPSWAGGSGTIRLTKGGGVVTAGVTYSIGGQQNIASLALNGATFSFAGVTADTGQFVINAIYAGVAYSRVISVKKVRDGSAAFRSEQPFGASASAASGSGNTTVPQNRTVTVSAYAYYTARPPGGGQTVGAIGYIDVYWRNLTDAGPDNYLGRVTGSDARTTNRGSNAEPDYDQVPGEAAGSFQFTSPSPDKQIAYRADFTSGGSAGYVAGNVALEIR